MNSEETEKIGVRGEYASPNRSDKWKPVWQALLIGVIASGLLIGAETIFPTSISWCLAFPGWMAMIFIWGFGPTPGPWPLVLFAVVNAVVYSILAFGLLVVVRTFSNKTRGNH